MKLRFSKRDSIIIGIVTLIVVFLIVYAQFFKLSPLKSDLGIKQQSLESEQKLLEIASQKKAEDTKKTSEDTKELQKKLPVEPLQEQLILDLEKAENLSNSKISSMSFSKDADVSTAADQANAENANGQQTTTNQTDTNQATANQDTAAQQAAANQTAGMKKMTVSLSVESPSYEKLEKFVETLESLKRIIVVESISYSGGEEITSLDQEEPPLTYSLTFSAFYMPSLDDLAAEIPKIDAPKPAGKDNPLSQFSATTETQP
ncbi:pilus assembly protein PilO [Neobacillus sp. OS1-33]|uniref:pilus assembly protein PilO n=1 Tax=Neobacillus sp. OS1-33 TaxID=3070683 RepID=UPI0027E0EB71|nr:pilus assembly protein PilO [Neobacillus sp. OS1-33]WML25433.1 pilus assembly protein PilO [Neobacillus sp. OS1-33]